MIVEPQDKRSIKTIARSRFFLQHFSHFLVHACCCLSFTVVVNSFEILGNKRLRKMAEYTFYILESYD